MLNAWAEFGFAENPCYSRPDVRMNDRLTSVTLATRSRPSQEALAAGGVLYGGFLLVPLNVGKTIADQTGIKFQRLE